MDADSARDARVSGVLSVRKLENVRLSPFPSERISHVSKTAKRGAPGYILTVRGAVSLKLRVDSAGMTISFSPV